MNLFKKTLLASVVAAVSTGAFAVDVATGSTAQTYGSEALTSGLVANDASVLTIGAVELLSGAEYTVGDIVKIAMSGGEFSADGAYTLTDNTGAGTQVVSFGLLNQTATELTFRVTALADATTTKARTFLLAGAGTLADAVTLGSTSVGAKLVVTANAETSTGITLDSAGSKDTFESGAVIAEHAVTANPVMAAVVDVTKERKEFVTPASATFTVDHTLTAADQANFAGTANTITVAGSMVGFPGTAATGILSDGAAALVVAADKQSAVGTYAAAPADKVMTFAVATDVTKREVLSKGDYTASMTITEGGKSIVVPAAIGAGAFALNGSVTDISYVPYGDNLEQFLWVTNKGTLAGEITVTAFDEAGKTYGPIAAGSVDGGKIARISSLVADGLEAEGFTSGRVALSVTVNSPSADITVYAAYKVASDADRLTLPTQPQ